MAVKFKFKKGNNQSTFPLNTLYDRLIKDKAIDMRNNYSVKELEDGYVVIKPNDETKLYK